MEGMSRAEIDRRESKDFALGKGPLRPRDAATLMLLESRGGVAHVLIGRRHRNHAFMPGKFVFPGGRTDPADARIPLVEGLHPADEAKMIAGSRPATAARARAIALSALRETYEEAGLMIGRMQPFASKRPDWREFVDRGVHPSLDRLRFVARAITPPGRVRRFDTRFLAAWRDDVAVALPDGGPTNELEELMWLPIDEAREADVPAITKTVLGDLKARLAVDPDLNPGGDVPFYRLLHNRMRRDIL
jgi:8-oxo-dGTP pyrophosphatase MutT (NUDIX family)